MKPFPEELRMKGVRAEEDGPFLDTDNEGRWCIYVVTQGGYDNTHIDVLDMVAWLKANRPDLLA